jgi:hypothetical protein
MFRFNIRLRRLYRFLRRWVFPLVGIISIVRWLLAVFHL